MADKIKTACRTCDAPIYLNRPACENGHAVPQDQIDELREKIVNQKIDHKRQGKKKKTA